jgi:hypothetical protein
MVGSFVSPYMTNVSHGEPDYGHVATDYIPKTLSQSLTRKHEVKETPVTSCRSRGEFTRRNLLTLNEKYKDVTGSDHNTWSLSLRRQIVRDISKLTALKPRKKVLRLMHSHKSHIHSVRTNIWTDTHVITFANSKRFEMADLVTGDGGTRNVKLEWRGSSLALPIIQGTAFHRLSLVYTMSFGHITTLSANIHA